jgi:hypothetical protein
MDYSTIMSNTLYYGDNLDVLRRYIKDDSVDLIYLDPPFNSNATYNVLFAERNGSRAGVYTSLWGSHPRIQILTTAELLEGKKIDMPPVGHTNVTFKKAERHIRKGKQSTFIDGGDTRDEQ